MNPGPRISVLAESSPALGPRRRKAIDGASHQCSAYVRHLEPEEATDLGEATGVVADT